MSEVLKERVRAVLARVQDPHTGNDLVSSGAVRGIGVDGDKVAVDLVLGYPALSWQPTLVAEVQRALADEAGVSAATVSVATRVAAHKVQKDLAPL
ncbi:MAG: iron-sulfur cluster assembly protein, partial [Xanthomonadales bacterium]|nr:iron-sulfur cluster assembly protein [Xanthomonadales bacterium]